MAPDMQRSKHEIRLETIDSYLETCSIELLLFRNSDKNYREWIKEKRKL